MIESIPGKKIVIIFLMTMLFIPAVFAYSDYCTPPDEADVNIDHNGDWYNITISNAICVLTSVGLECAPELAPPPIANFSASPREGDAPLTVHFTDLSTGGCPDAWLWVFGDGGTAAIQNPDYTYWSGGNFTVTLAVHNFTGGSDIKIIPLYINVSGTTPAPTGTPSPITVSDTGKVEVGETWIRWQWREMSDNITTNVYADGQLLSWNSSFNYTYLQGLQPLEKHNIQVYNSSNTSELLYDSTRTTLYPKGNIFFFMGIQVLLIILLMASRDPIKIVLIGAVNIAFALYTSAISYGYEGLYLLPLIIAMVSGAYLAIKIWEFARGNIKWY